MDTQLQKPRHNSPPNTIMADPTFHPFPKLPTELRFAVWELAFPGPRTITPILPHGETENLISRPQNPSTLYVNKEARDITLKCYMKIETPHGSRYVNFAVDCVQLEYDIFEYRTRDEEPGDFLLPWQNLPADPRQATVAQFGSLKETFANTRTLEVHLSEWTRYFDRFLYEWLRSFFPRVEKVTLVHPPRMSAPYYFSWTDGPYFDIEPIIDHLQACLDEFSSGIRKPSGETMGEVEIWKRAKVEIVIADIEKPPVAWLW
jgi:hypothetical protein